MDIEKIAYDYLNTEPEKPKRKQRRTRKALLSQYEAARNKYVQEKNTVDSILESANKLKKQYDKHVDEMNKFMDKMKVLRQKINDLDDSGKDFIPMYQEDEEQDIPQELLSEESE